MDKLKKDILKLPYKFVPRTFFENYQKKEWISVKDKLPSKNEYVLAFDGNNMCVCWTDIGSHDYLFMFGMNSRSQFKNVTHWMPLPEPPK